MNSTIFTYFDIYKDWKENINNMLAKLYTYSSTYSELIVLKNVKFLNGPCYEKLYLGKS